MKSNGPLTDPCGTPAITFLSELNLLLIWTRLINFLGDFNMTQGSKDRSTGSKGFCESQEEHDSH